MNKTKEIRYKKINTRLYPIYKMISWDLLFYYSIIFLFLTQAKNFSASQVLLGEAFFTASCLIFQIPIGVLVDRIGKKKSLIFANICMCIFSFMLIVINSFNQLLIAYFIDAIGYVIKGICETNILYDSLPKGKKRGGLYSTIDGLGASRYYIVDAITSIIAGFAYVINPYLPIILCFIANLFSTILSTKFRNIQLPNEEEENKTTIHKYFKDLKEAIKFSIKSKRMRALLVFFGLMSGLLYNITTLRSGVLNQIQIPEQYFGIIFALSQVIASIMSKSQNMLNRKLKNHTLAFLGIPLTISCIIIGILSNISVSLFSTYAIICLFIFQGGIKGAYNVLIYRYLNNFTIKGIRTKLATIRNILYSIFSIIISLIGAAFLNVTLASYTIIIIGCITTIIMILLLDYMRDKVGLKISQYDKEDLKYNPNNN